MDATVKRIIDLYYDNNNDFFHAEIAICMLQLCKLFRDEADFTVKNAFDAAAFFWTNYQIGEINNSDELIHQKKLLTSHLHKLDYDYKEKKSLNVLQALSVKSLLHTFDEVHLDDNIDVFTQFIHYIIQMKIPIKVIDDTLNKQFRYLLE